MQKTGIVIPCYNERARLSKESFLVFAEANPAVSFIMVDDGSDDGTMSLLEDLQRSNPVQFFALRLSNNKGKAEAVRHGMKAAMDWQPFEFIGFFDADLSTPLSEIHTLLSAFSTIPGQRANGQ